jgi:hypothetical protein
MYVFRIFTSKQAGKFIGTLFPLSRDFGAVNILHDGMNIGHVRAIKFDWARKEFHIGDKECFVSILFLTCPNYNLRKFKAVFTGRLCWIAIVYRAATLLISFFITQIRLCFIIVVWIPKFFKLSEMAQVLSCRRRILTVWICAEML